MLLEKNVGGEAVKTIPTLLCNLFDFSQTKPESKSKKVYFLPYQFSIYCLLLFCGNNKSSKFHSIKFNGLINLKFQSLF